MSIVVQIKFSKNLRNISVTKKFGVLPSQRIEKLFKNGIIISNNPFEGGQIQPASLDLRLGRKAWRVRASFLPGYGTKIEKKLSQLKMEEIDLTTGALLERKCVYIVKLQESLNLENTGIKATTNPKSSTGRLDVFTRVITDFGESFDLVPDNYVGPLYAEICPLSFPIKVRTGCRLSQIRFRIGDPAISATDLQEIYKDTPFRNLWKSSSPKDFQLSVDLAGKDENSIVGYRAKHYTDFIDFDRINEYTVENFWEPILRHPGKSLSLVPNEFYILASKEHTIVPPLYAAEMLPIETTIGEFRVHYAGFFDPGFGHFGSGSNGSRAVLEVRSHDVPFILEDSQPVGYLVYEHMYDKPNIIYGKNIRSNYQGQSLKLSKHFKTPVEPAKSIQSKKITQTKKANKLI